MQMKQASVSSTNHSGGKAARSLALEAGYMPGAATLIYAVLAVRGTPAKMFHRELFRVGAEASRVR
jgi:hypothetical protein